MGIALHQTRRLAWLFHLDWKARVNKPPQKQTAEVMIMIYNQDSQDFREKQDRRGKYVWEEELAVV